MIKINLAPVDELESPYWFVPDVAMVLVIAFTGFLGVRLYLGSMQQEIDTLTADRDSFQTSYDQLSPDLQRYKNLDASIKTLREKVDSLRGITISTIARYKPVVIMEHLQNLKPDGVWFWNVKVMGGGKEVAIMGQAFDNLLVAELMTGIGATASQDAIPGDVRSQVYLQNVRLEQSMIMDQAKPGFLELKNFPEFKISADVGERIIEKTDSPPLAQGESVSEDVIR